MCAAGTEAASGVLIVEVLIVERAIDAADCWTVQLFTRRIQEAQSGQNPHMLLWSLSQIPVPTQSNTSTTDVLQEIC